MGSWRSFLKNKYRVVIAGGGVVGCAIARELSQYENLSITLLEKEDDVCSGTSKANNSHIVCGADLDPSCPVEIEMIRRSNKRWESITAELDVEYTRCGSFNVAVTESEFNDTLPALQKKAQSCGIFSTRIIGRDELLSKEPYVNPDALGALYAPEDGSLLSYYLVLALAENAAVNGVKFLFESEVTALSFSQEGKFPWTVEINNGEKTLDADFVINSAGLYSDAVSKMAGWDNFEIRPRKGEFWVIDKKYSSLVNSIVYGCPQPDFRGTTVVKTRDGNLMVGPTARDLRDKEEKGTTQDAMEAGWAAAKRVFPWLDKSMTIHQYAGLRARCAEINDYIIGWHPDGVKPFINAAAIRSTGISGSIGIGEYIAELLTERITLEKNPLFNPVRKKIKRFETASWSEREALVKENPLYGEIICRCQTVSKAEIIEAIHNPLGVVSLDGIKRRTKTQMGRCSGGFCTPRIVKIICEETGSSPLEITKRGRGTEILKRETKNPSSHCRMTAGRSGAGK
ncbi:MAG: NAD(P)/FAD-dependent oxidoreductase [Spirochaetia bacterium]|nr:NAD(P)/FAD-dependent oxidoreductase [Spirochaetia bacterium]